MKELENTYVHIDEEENVVYICTYKELTDGSEIDVTYKVPFTADMTKESLLAEYEKAKAAKPEEVSIYTEKDTVTKEMLNEIKANKTTASVYGNSRLEWQLDGTKITDNDKEFSIGAKVGSAVDEELAKKISALFGKDDKGLIIDFAHSGALPLGTKVSLYIGDQEYADQKMNLYYYNPNTNKLEFVMTITDKEIDEETGEIRTVTFPLAHCSQYVILPAKNNAKTGVLNVALYAGLAGLALVGIVVVAKKKNN